VATRSCGKTTAERLERGIRWRNALGGDAGRAAPEWRATAKA
jgi:hypothetical protein